MELNVELASLNLKELDVEIIKVQKDFDSSFCGSSAVAVCRVCLDKCHLNKMCNIFDSFKPMHICDMIMTFAAVQIMEGDGLPTMICHHCITKLNTAWEFKMLCENSDAKLRNVSESLHISSNLDSLTISVKQQEHSLCEEKSETYNQSSNNISDFTVEDSDSAKSDRQENGELMSVKPSRTKQATAKTKSTQKDNKLKIHQCHLCGKAFHRREYLTQHFRTHTGEKPYKCHLCDKRFVNSGHLSTHMRTHTGERPHACTLCPKAFSTKQELQKHIMVHKGEKPFTCKVCDKKFSTSSNLYTHQKHHTGEKNFKCEQCKKAFYTKQELKQHIVVHTGEKMFLCEVCNKRFSQIAHLKRHVKTHLTKRLM